MTTAPSPIKPLLGGRAGQAAGDGWAPTASGGGRDEGVALVERIRGWGHELGFSQIGVTGIDLASAEAGLSAWLEAGFHGSMHYMARHGLKRARPDELVPGTVSVICVRLDYLPNAQTASTSSAPPDAPDASAVQAQLAHELSRVQQPDLAVVSIYARGRDYHKVLRQRLAQLAERMEKELGPLGHRVFTDSAPVLEVELATRAGLGWRGKHTLLLSREAGSFAFLGEIFVDVALPVSAPQDAHCGTCSACIDVCPTGAIVAPYRLDARRCISYLTIEHDGPIPIEWRSAIGNRIYGCDDCQLACPWNKFARTSPLEDFNPRHGLDGATLLELWRWSEPQFDERTLGSAIRRIGWQRWRRNLAVGLGNALAAPALAPAMAEPIRQALHEALAGADELVAEHIGWASAQGVAAALSPDLAATMKP
jgi:epoxyqueuosine reductase